MASYPSYSPYSSIGNVDSVTGTPDTRLTGFSPDDPRLTRAAFKNGSSGTLQKDGFNDPFVTLPQGKDAKLSATASAFRPIDSSALSLNAVVAKSSPSSGTAEHLNKIVEESVPPSPTKVSESKFGTFTTDRGPRRGVRVSNIYVESGKSVDAAVKASLNLLQKNYKMKVDLGFVQFGDSIYMHMDHIEDAVAVYNAVRKDNSDFHVEYISPVEFGSVASPASKSRYSAHEGQIFVSCRYPKFPDREGFEATIRALLTVDGPFWAWKRLNAADAEIFQFIGEYANARLASRCVARCAHLEGTPLGQLKGSVVHYNSSLLKSRNPQDTPTRSPSHYEILTESLDRFTIDTVPPSQNFPPSMSRHGPGIPSHSGQFGPMMPLFELSPKGPTGPPFGPSMHSNQFSPSMFSSPSGSGSPYFRTLGYHHGFERQFTEVSPTPLTGPPRPSYEWSNSNGMSSRNYLLPSPNRRGVLSPPTARNSPTYYSGPSQHNHVDPHRIQAGIDVRTTVMLRNIPNKVNQAELKIILDESSLGRYDFAYLRIDFSNDCNVGYAFINFADPLDIIPFFHARSGRRWTTFRSDKIAEVSYATIQGRDCLIQKFRNSSVMLEASHYRPKLFYTIHDHLHRPGTEEEFPPSDNASKLKRSCENAEHVGLFAPSAGQSLRDEQRRRHSQFDRGNSLAEREEYEYDSRHRSVVQRSPGAVGF